MAAPRIPAGAPHRPPRRGALPVLPRGPRGFAAELRASAPSGPWSSWTRSSASLRSQRGPSPHRGPAASLRALWIQRPQAQDGGDQPARRPCRRAVTSTPFVPEELGSAFDLETALRFGTLPVVWAAPDRGEALAAYAQLYLKEEVQAEALVRNLPGFARFLPWPPCLTARSSTSPGSPATPERRGPRSPTTSRSSRTRSSPSACRPSKRSSGSVNGGTPSCTGPMRASPGR